MDKNTTFLVTGGAGFIGSNLCQALLNMGYSVRCLDNLSTGKVENMQEFFHDSKFEFVNGDIRNYEVCKKVCADVTYILHQAAWGSVPRSIEHPLLYEEINIRGTLNMMDAARESAVSRFVYASSSSVYGDSTCLPMTEGHEGNALSPYALTKKVNEDYAKLYFELYGLETVGLRYFNVFGRRQNPEGDYAAVIPKFIKAILRKETPVIYGDGSQARDFTYIGNVIQANLKACMASKSAAGKAFNVACGENHSVLELQTLLCKLIGVDVPPRFAGSRPGDIKNSAANLEAAAHYIDYFPEHSFAKGIELTLEWYKKNI